MKKYIKTGIVFFLLSVILLAFFNFENNSIVTTNYEYRSGKIPKDFNDYTIVQLSDLHNKMFGKNQSPIINKVVAAKPNVIFFTGDLVDSTSYNKENSLILINELVKIAPVYYVTGNHEWWSGKYQSLKKDLLKTGVHILSNACEPLQSGKDTINLLGIDDPTSVSQSISNEYDAANSYLNQAQAKCKDTKNFSVLLSHRPELIKLYSQRNTDIVFSGHAHGGQFRIPFIGGVVAPNQGIFPKYTAGKYKEGDTTMIVNRGLGNSIIPLRIFNRPEIIVVKLKTN